jgi:RNA polymerase sigma-70 factor (ECF subfamily)
VELSRLFADLYRASPAPELGITLESFQDILKAIGAHCLPPNAGAADTHEFFRNLRMPDLVLARACAAGNELAWERFLTLYREKLYLAAASIAQDDAMGRELADSLYSNLFGTRRDGQDRRVSKLASYTGRGSLEGWLRAVLAREYTDRFRSRRRLVSFESALEAGIQFSSAESPEAPDARLAPAVDAALSSLSAEERMILASYYLDDRTLTEIARMLGVHESTISRRLDKIKAGIRKRTLRALRTAGVNWREAEQLLEADVRDLNLDVKSRLLQEKGKSAVL